MKRILLSIIPLAVLLSICPVHVQGQSANRVLQGVVTGSDGAMAGATVYIQNEDQRIIAGTVTGLQGEYLLTVPEGDNLRIVIGFIGCKSVSARYTGQATFNARLVSDDRSIDEVVVSARVGRTSKEGIQVANQGTASEYLDVSQFDDMSVTSLEDMLQGKMANLDIVAASGDPGTSATIRIRGSASLNADNNPLIVIDGIPQDTEIDEDFDFGDANVENFSTLVNISPNDIQSIEVLKDAGATALWGPRAASGVLLITTKQGGVHKPTFSLSQKFNYSFEPKRIPMLNGQEYVTLMQDALWNWAKDNDYGQTQINKLTNQKDILYDRSYEYFDEFNVNTDWLKLISRSSLNSTTDFSMSGGGEVANYRFSLGYEDQKATTRGTDFNRLTSRLNVTIKFSKKFKVDSRFNYAESVRNQPFGTTTNDLNIGTNTGSIYEGTNAKLTDPIRNVAMAKMPNMSPWVLDDEGRPTAEYFSAPESSLQGIYPNVLALVEESLNRTRNRTVGASFGSSYELAKGLRLFGTVSFSMSTTRNNSFLPSSVLNVKWANQNYNRAVEAQANKTYTFAELRLNYNLVVNKKHAMNFSFGDQIEATNNNSYSISTSGSGAMEVSFPSSEGKIVQMGSAWAKRRTVGVVGSANYVYDNRYSISFAARMNASSNVGLDNHWTNLRPTVHGVWRINNEKFMKSVKWVNELRVKGSYGQSDRAPNSNATVGTFANESAYMDYASIKPNRIQLNNLTPETVTEYNLGMEAGFFKNKVNLVFEYYNKTTKNLLQQNTEIQSTTGYSTIRWFNAGSINNQGWEVMVNLSNIITAGKFKLSLNNVNFSRNVNKITELPENMTAEKYTLGNANYPRKINQGNPVGSIYGYIFDGIYQNYDETLARDAKGNYIYDIDGKPVPIRVGGTTSMRPGDARYVDLNYDGIIDEQDIIYLGSSFPTFTCGATLVLSYKSWTLRTSMHCRAGQSIINMTRHTMEQMNNGNNQARTALNRWRYEGDDTDIPRALWGTNYNSMGSSKFVEDGSFVKIKDVTINYRLPQKFCNKFGVSRANVFFTTYNLITFTNYTGQDPEVGTGSGAYGLAIDRNRTPPAKRIAMGASFDF